MGICSSKIVPGMAGEAERAQLLGKYASKCTVHTGMWVALAHLVVSNSSKKTIDSKQVQVIINKDTKRRLKTTLGLTFFTDGQDDTKSEKNVNNFSDGLIKHLNSFPVKDHNEFFADEEDGLKACDLVFKKILPVIPVNWKSWNDLTVQSELAFSGLGQCNRR